MSRFGLDTMAESARCFSLMSRNKTEYRGCGTVRRNRSITLLRIHENERNEEMAKMTNKSLTLVVRVVRVSENLISAGCSFVLLLQESKQSPPPPLMEGDELRFHRSCFLVLCPL
jgi:hypothetical protein